MTIVVMALQRTGGQTFYQELRESLPSTWVHLREGLHPRRWGEEVFTHNYNTIMTTDCSTVKVIPQQAVHPEINIIDDICSKADRIIYLTRNDLEAQTRSHVICGLSDEWMDSPSTVNNGKITSPAVAGIARAFVKQWMQMEEIYNKYPGEVVALEDRVQAPYIHNKQYDPGYEWPDISPQVREFEEFQKTSNLFKAGNG